MAAGRWALAWGPPSFSWLHSPSWLALRAGSWARMGRKCLGGVCRGVCLGWRAGVMWGSRCRIMGPPGEAQGAGAATEGVRLSLYTQLWWAQSRRGIPESRWATLAHAQRLSRCLGSGTQPSPTPRSQQPPGCHDNEHFHPCPFVWSQSSFCGQAIMRGVEKGALPQDALGWGVAGTCCRAGWRGGQRKLETRKPGHWPLQPPLQMLTTPSELGLQLWESPGPQAFLSLC